MHQPERPAPPLTERSPRVVSAVKLLRAHERKRAGLVLAEGENAVVAALTSPERVRDVFVREDAAERFAEVVSSARAAGVRTALVNERAAQRLSDTVSNPGLFVVTGPLDGELDAVLTQAAGGGLLAVGVEVSEPGNAGSLLRAADALGAGAVVFAGATVDPHNPKALRASAGSAFTVPFARSDSPEALVSDLRARGFTVLATTVDGELDLDALIVTAVSGDPDALLARPTAWLFGNEAHGLAPEVAAAADHRVRIRIHGGAESLNFATAAAVCLHGSALVRGR